MGVIGQVGGHVWAGNHYGHKVEVNFCYLLLNIYFLQLHILSISTNCLPTIYFYILSDLIWLTMCKLKTKLSCTGPFVAYHLWPPPNFIIDKPTDQRIFLIRTK